MPVRLVIRQFSLKSINQVPQESKIARLLDRATTVSADLEARWSSYCTKAVVRAIVIVLERSVEHWAQLLVRLDVSGLTTVGALAGGALWYRVHGWSAWCWRLTVDRRIGLEDALLLLACVTTLLVALETSKLLLDAR